MAYSWNAGVGSEAELAIEPVGDGGRLRGDWGMMDRVRLGGCWSPSGRSVGGLGDEETFANFARADTVETMVMIPARREGDWPGEGAELEQELPIGDAPDGDFALLVGGNQFGAIG